MIVHIAIDKKCGTMFQLLTEMTVVSDGFEV